MKLTSIQSRREAIYQTLTQCRRKTLDLFTEIDSDTFCQQAHPEFSPVGWHLGHIAFTEAYWILEQCAGYSPLLPQYQKLFAADGLPKAKRQKLPGFEVTCEYLDTVRSKVLTYLETAPVEQEERLWRWLIQHESQHSETITFVLQLHHWTKNVYPLLNFFQPKSISTEMPEATSKKRTRRYSTTSGSFKKPVSKLDEMVEIPAGEFMMGSDRIEAQDNERPAHRVYLDTYWLDRYPVTCKQYREFMMAGGYQNHQYWSDEGWQWLQTNPVSQPLYWSDASEWDDHPVCGVSYYEAEAYARFKGKRLPTEAEWEKAASWDAAKAEKIEALPVTSLKCNHDTLVGHTTPVTAYPASQSCFGCYDMLGNVWEWTTSWFAGYEGFTHYPYPGYSKVYFDRQHRVLKGGSWATRPWALRASFRNWYHPWVRQIFAGFRCAAD